jgi:ribosomal small subunit protein bTHX
MGKGDKKTRKGKINRGSYGVSRKRAQRNTNPNASTPKAAVKTAKSDTIAETAKTTSTTKAKAVKKSTKAKTATTAKKKPAAKKVKE